MRITAVQRIENENRIRAAMDRLQRGEIPPGGKCDIKTFAREADVDRTAFYGNRPYAHLREEFENRLQHLQETSQTPDPKIAQIDRLKAENSKLKDRLARAQQTIEELGDFRNHALAQLAAQYEKIFRIRAGTDARVARLPAPRARAEVIGPC